MSAPAALLAADDDQLTVAGGGGDYFMPWHWHDCVMIFLPQRGAVEFRDESRASGAWLSEDRFVVVPKGVAHQTAAARGGHSHLAIYSADAQLERIEARLGSLSRVRARLGAPTVFAMTPEIRSLQRLCRAGDTSDELLQAARGHLAAALLMNCLSQIERGEELSTARRDGHGEVLVAEMTSFITENAGKDLPLDIIADRFGLSRRHATRLFRDNTGVTIAAFQERERLRQARELLTGTTLPIGDVAWRTGFDSGSALARSMRRVDGLTPSAVRKTLARSDKN